MVPGHGAEEVGLTQGGGANGGKVRHRAVHNVLRRPAVEEGIRGGAVVGGVEGAFIVHGQGAQHQLVGLGGGRIGNGQGEGQGQRAGGGIHGVNVVVAAHGVEGIVGAVIGHVGDGGGGAGEGSHQLQVRPVALGRNIEVAVLHGHVDIALHILGGADIGGQDIRHAARQNGSGAVRDVGGIDLQPALAAAAVVAVAGDKAVHLAGVILRLAAVVDLIDAGVSGVVHKRDLALGSDLVRRDADLQISFVPGGALGGDGLTIDHAAGQVRDLCQRQELIILDLQDETAVLQIFRSTQKLRRGIIHGEGGGEQGAFPKLPGGDQRGKLLVRHGVSGGILRQSHKRHGELLILCHTQGADDLADGVVLAGVLPLPGIAIVEGSGHISDQLVLIEDASAAVRHHQGQDLGAADQGEVIGIEGVSALHGGALRHILGVQDVGIAELPVLLVAAPVADDEVVGVVVAGVGQDALSVGVARSGLAVKHAGVRPVAVKAQHRDRVGGIGDLALLRGDRLHADVALHIGAVGSAGIHGGLCFLRQGNGNADLHAAACWQGEEVRRQAVEKQVGIVGIHGAVPADIRDGVNAVREACGVAQDQLGIIGIGVAVLVQVAVIGGVQHIFLSVHGITDGGTQGSGLGVQIQPLGAAALLFVGGRKDRLGKELAGEGVVPHLVRQVIEGEGKLVLAAPLGVVTQLGLDLAVRPGSGGIFVHLQVAAGGSGAAHVGKARALLQQGIGGAAVFRIPHRLGGGHQQALDQLTLSKTALFRQAVFPEVLGQHRCHTGHLGRGHGGAGHGLIGIMAAGHFAGGSAVVAVGRVDTAAGGGDLGLQLQAAGHAPGGEGTHGIAAPGDLGSDALRYGELAKIVEDVALLVRDGLSVGLQGQGIRLGDGDAGGGVVIVAEVHVKHAGLVVAHDGANGTGAGGAAGLFQEGGGAAVADGDAALQCGTGVGKFRSAADAVKEDILLLPGQGGHGPFPGEGLRVKDVLSVDGEIVPGEARVIRGSHGKGAGEGTGGTHIVQIHVIAVEVAQVFGVLCPVAGVACAHGDHGAVFRQAVQQGLVEGVAGKARVAGAQGQVDAVTAQQDGILDGGHVVGIVSAAVSAEDLHDKELRVRGHALDLDALQRGDEAAILLGEVGVGSGNTGNVGAVLSGGVVFVGHVQRFIHIVEGEGDLAAAVKLLGSDAVGVEMQGVQGVFHLDRIQQAEIGKIILIAEVLGRGILGQGVFKGGGIEGLVGQVQAGINDSHAAARAGVALGPDGGGADHATGGRHHGVGGLLGIQHGGEIPGLQDHLLHAGNILDLFHVTVGHIGGNDIGCQGQVPDHVQLLPVQHLAGDAVRHGGLLPLQPHAVAGGLGIAADAAEGVTRLQGGSLLQNDGDADNVRVGVESGTLRVIGIGPCAGVWRAASLRLGEEELL